MADEVISIHDLVHDENNARVHTEGNIAQITRSLTELGAGRSILIEEDNVVLAGNGTIEAAKLAGIKRVRIVEAEGDELIAVRRSNLTEEGKVQLAIADNRTAETARWDVEKLSGLSTEYDIGAYFSDEELSRLVDVSTVEVPAPESVTPPDDRPSEADEEAEEEAPERVTYGDLWSVGSHRLLCGDGRDIGQVERVLDGAVFDICVTSPPYASQRKYDKESAFKPIHPDVYVDWFAAVASSVETYLSDTGSYFLNIKEHTEEGGRHLYVKDLTLAHVRQWGWTLVDEFAWVKSGVPGAWKDRFKNSWEPVFHFSRGGAIHFDPWAVSHESDMALGQTARGTPLGVDVTKTTGESSFAKFTKDSYGAGQALPGNVIKAESERGQKHHTAPYPVSLVAFFLKAFSPLGATVYDPFGGTGTTAVAAHRNGRGSATLEISPRYCDHILARLERETGEPARLLS